MILAGTHVIMEDVRGKTDRCWGRDSNQYLRGIDVEG